MFKHVGPVAAFEPDEKGTSCPNCENVLTYVSIINREMKKSAPTLPIFNKYRKKIACMFSANKRNAPGDGLVGKPIVY